MASSNDLGVGVWLLVLNDQTVFEVEVRVEIDESLGARWIVWDEELESVTGLPDRGFGVDGNALVLVGVGVNLDVTSLLFNVIVTISSQNVVQSLVLAQFRSGIFAKFDISNTIAIETVLKFVLWQLLMGKRLPVDINVHEIGAWLHIFNLDVSISVLS